MTPAPPGDPREQRLATLLVLARDRPPEPPASQPERIMRTARWQYALRGALHALSELSTIVAVGLRWLIASPTPPDRREAP